MKKTTTLIAIALAFAGGALAAATGPSPYTGQESRDIKALSGEDVDSLLAGKGMGYAKAAELNGYPGPAHVLELSSELGLSAEQRARTQALFASMQSKAVGLGAALVGEERRLDRLFADKAITPEKLAASLAAIGALQAKVRGVHLEAHLAQVAILTPEQVGRYSQLRGYSGAHDPSSHDSHKH
jgi:hypothetical protein